SIANMFSSTYNAIFASFRAILEVVEQLSRLKAELFLKLFSSSLLRFVFKLWRNILVFLRIQPANYAVSENVWFDATSQRLPERPYKLSSLLFWIVALGGPWLVIKCLSTYAAFINDSKEWCSGQSEHYVAKALYDFEARSKDELSVRAGDMLRVAPKHRQPLIQGWILACTESGDRFGLLPINYVKVLRKECPNMGLVKTSATFPSTMEDTFESLFNDLI
ncbi:hypothetical protein AB6A40_007956, partial [Gnathostoma spinigerum]